MLQSIHLKGVGPAPEMRVDFAQRLNFLTGDNGLGKTFLLDAAWFVLTRTWARKAKAIPRPGTRDASITYRYDKTTPGAFEGTAVFDWEEYAWGKTPGRPPIPGVVVYAGVDGSFAAWDPARNYWKDSEQGRERPRSFDFTPEEVWRGASGPDGTRYCNGLIHDWVFWQKSRDPVFDELSKVLDVLSPEPAERMEPGEPAHLDPLDETEYPTLRMPYGQDVPLTYASAGMRRIAALAYLLVWTWNGHRRASKQSGSSLAKDLIFLVDEVECHLHPQWQRRVVPALLRVVDSLTAGSGISVQIVAATHSPLVLASAEPDFRLDEDALFHMDLEDGRAVIERVPWSKQGDVANWLVSETFGLQQARSVEAERAIEAAEAFMRSDTAQMPEGLRNKEQIDQELRRVLAGHDDFWPRWVVWAERNEAEARVD